MCAVKKNIPEELKVLFNNPKVVMDLLDFDTYGDDLVGEERHLETVPEGPVLLNLRLPRTSALGILSDLQILQHRTLEIYSKFS